MGKIKKVSLLFAFLLFVITYADSPTVPYYQFTVQGRIELAAGGSLLNYPVVLLGKGRTTNNEFVIVKGMNYDNEKPVALTSAGGSFTFTVCSPYPFDSLKVAVIRTPAPMAESSTHAIDSRMVREIKKTVEGKSGCSACATETLNYVTEKYEYNYYNTVIGF